MIHVQGFEFEGSQGAVGILPQALAIVPSHEGHAAFDEIYSFVRQHNFKLADLGEPIRNSRGGEVLYFDVAFLNNSMASLPVRVKAP